MAVQPQPVMELPEAPPRLAAHDLVQHLDHVPIALHARLRSPIPRRPRQPHHAAGPHDRDPMLLHENLRGLPLRERPYSFRLSTSLIAVFSRARSAYIRLSFTFSASRSFSRLSSETLTPPYFARQLKYVGRLIPCLRIRSLIG